MKGCGRLNCWRYEKREEYQGKPWEGSGILSPSLKNRNTLQAVLVPRKCDVISIFIEMNGMNERQK